nr:MAG: phosphatase PAP2 family protein [Hyphomicrobiales bacterium]
MMLWLGAALLVAGIPLLMLDRQAANFFRYNPPPAPVLKALIKTTDAAKGGPWIVGILVLFLGTQPWSYFYGSSPTARFANDIALALLVSLITGSVVLHAIKLFLGRRRPRDDFEHGLYGFVFFQWHLQHNSFPSGHALTIFCVATWASALLPAFAILWIAIASYFAMTRAILAVHFLSDVAIGAAIGIIATRETLVLLFPQLAPAWF